MTTLTAGFDFALDAAREADQPPEERGDGRDDVRLLHTDKERRHTRGHHFRQLPDLLRPDDLLVVNDSATLAAAVWLPRLVVHFSTDRGDGSWLVELRERAGNQHEPYFGGTPGEKLPLPGGNNLTLLAKYSDRLWVTQLDASVPRYLAKHGVPIRYSYVDRHWPLARYQTVFATRPGSAEMPSAGRPFTSRMLQRLHQQGVEFATVTLHTGVASAETDEIPYPERFAVNADTARAANRARARGGRVIAVGTTVVRALESAVAADGTTQAAGGFTEHIVTPSTGVRVVDGILTGLHEPRSTHLSMLSAIVDNGVLAEAYRTAVTDEYLWHEFGDVHLIA